jgi:hypothetical protein
MNAEEIIRKMEEIEEEGLPPIEFARKSAEVFNKWAEENPGEVEVLMDQRLDWCLAYKKRVGRRLQGVDRDDIWADRTTQEEENMP